MASSIENISNGSNYIQDNRTSLGYRELIILALGTISKDTDRLYLYNRFKSLSKQSFVLFLGYNIQYEIYNKMLNKMIRNGIIKERHNSEVSKYYIELTNLGLGELDSILFSNAELENHLLRYSYLNKKLSKSI